MTSPSDQSEPTLIDAVRRVQAALRSTAETVCDEVQPYESPTWLQRFEYGVSDLAGFLLVLSRLAWAVSILMWSIFSMFLPLLIATWMIVIIIAMAGARGPGG